MPIVGTILSLVVDLALGLWLGTIGFFSFVAAPRTFAVLSRDRAGDVVNDIFPRYYRLGVTFGAVAVVVAGLGLFRPGRSVWLFVVVTGAGLGVVLAAYSVWILIPRMEEAGDAAFETYHRRSVVLNGLTLLVVLVAFVASHVAAWG